jgi:phosphoribosyl-AMP cyclohydrolase
LQLAFEKMQGLLPAVIQAAASDQVLMLGFMNRESLEMSQKTGEVYFFSRSRNKLWKKGETSGHVLRVQEIRVDCDADSLLIRVEAMGPGVCHEGYRSCFFRELEKYGSARVVEEKTFEVQTVYGKGAE